MAEFSNACLPKLLLTRGFHLLWGFIAFAVAEACCCCGNVMAIIFMTAVITSSWNDLKMPWVFFISRQREHLTFAFAHPPILWKSATAKAKISLSLLPGVQKNRQLIFTNTYVHVSLDFTSTPSYSCSSTTQYCGSPSWLSHLEIDWCFMVTHAMSHTGMNAGGPQAAHAHSQWNLKCGKRIE